jgi:hypothetical protein
MGVACCVHVRYVQNLVSETQWTEHSEDRFIDWILQQWLVGEWTGLT